MSERPSLAEKRVRRKKEIVGDRQMRRRVQQSVANSMNAISNQPFNQIRYGQQ